jgi:hypothetical protein
MDTELTPDQMAKSPNPKCSLPNVGPKPKPSKVLRCSAEYLGGTKVRYTFPCCDHMITKDHSKGPVIKRWTEDTAKFYTRYWGLVHHHGGHTGGVGCGACPKCLPHHAIMGIKGGRKYRDMGARLRAGLRDRLPGGRK